MSEVEYLKTGASNWISFSNSDGGILESSCDCIDDGECYVSLSTNGTQYKDSFPISLDSSGLAAGTYQAQITVETPTSSLSIPISMTVNAGEVVASKTTWKFSDARTTDGILRVENSVAVEIVPRDQFGTKTLVAPNGMNIEELYFTLSWYLVNGNCPSTYNNGVCSGVVNAAYSDQG